jgi:hypothetical protein
MRATPLFVLALVFSLTAATDALKDRHKLTASEVRLEEKRQDEYAKLQRKVEHAQLELAQFVESWRASCRPDQVLGLKDTGRPGCVAKPVAPEPAKPTPPAPAK